MMILPFSARLRDTLLTLTLTLLSGCALIQDEPAQVAIVNPQQAQLAQVIHLANSNWPAARWWEAYDDPQLNMLINRALQNSPTMQAARLRISQSQSTVELAQSAMGLQATAVAAQNRLRITDKSFSWPYSYSLPVDKNGPWYTLNTVGVGAQLNIDLWGADRARVAAAIGEKNARLAETPALSSTSPAAWRSSISPCRRHSRKSRCCRSWRALPSSRWRPTSTGPNAVWRIAWTWPRPGRTARRPPADH